MPTPIPKEIKTKSDLFGLQKWDQLKSAYYGKLSFASSGERAEEYGAKTHQLHKKLSNLEEFWRCHVAPATNRPDNTFLSAKIDPVVSRMAERNYQVYGYMIDALDELRILKSGSNPGDAPRYRIHLNVLHFCGDALMLYKELIDVIEGRNDHVKAGLAQALGLPEIGVREPDRFSERYEQATCYRHMLAHQGRPWYCFVGPEFESEPYVVKWDHCRKKGTPSGSTRQLFKSWKEQQDLFDADQTKFLPLSLACDSTARWAISLLNDGYARLVAKLHQFLDHPRYRELWGWPKPPSAS